MAQPQRCGTCWACKYVENAKQHFIPTPPLTHASDELSQMWNEVLAQYHCDLWDAETVSNYRREFDKLSAAIRPVCHECEGDGWFRTPIKGVIAHLVDGKLPVDGAVERCDRCKRYATDVAALQVLRKFLKTTNGVATNNVTS